MDERILDELENVPSNVADAFLWNLHVLIKYCDSN